MKKSTVVTVAAVVAIVPMALLALSINANKAEQKIINTASAASLNKRSKILSTMASPMAGSLCAVWFSS